jgi:CheY-like chemotaxis protein
LAAQHGVELRAHYGEASSLSGLAAHPVAVTQMLLNLLTLAISIAPSGSCVDVIIKPQSYDTEIEVRGACMQGLSMRSQDRADSLEMARRLAELSGGGLTCSEDTETFVATASLPVLEQLPVLLIDDNTDTLQLLQRYTSATRYRLIGASDPGDALELAQTLMPRLIVLDVMMPQVDGWRVLGQLRNHPLTHDIPVIVCTILAQEALALSLGASDYIRKPVTREAFLAALDRQID